MANITEPEVVFCEFNHIYDKSLNDSCPYCKQIAERTNQMKRQLNGSSQKAGGKFWNFFRSRSNDSDATVLLQNSREDDDDATVLVSSLRDEDDDVTELHTVARVSGMDDEKTEYRTDNAADEELTELRVEQLKPDTAPVETISIQIDYAESKQDDPISVVICETPVAPAAEEAVQREAQKEETASAAPRRKVIGWLVCACGEPNYGTSVELREGNNGVMFDDDGRVRIGDTGTVVIYRDRMTGIFQIRAEGDAVVTVNERTLNGSTYLEPYSRIQIREHGFVFFPAVGVCGFEWRQS